jgi:hypothetical protein
MNMNILYEHSTGFSTLEYLGSKYQLVYLSAESPTINSAGNFKICPSRVNFSFPHTLTPTMSMGSLDETCASLRAQITATEAQLAGLKRDLANAEQAAQSEAATTAETQPEDRNGEGRRWPLLQEEYKRYGRQMIVSQVGLKGKSRLRFGGNYSS